MRIYKLLTFIISLSVLLVPLISLKKEPAEKISRLLYVAGLVVLDPLVDLGLSQTQDVLSGVGRSLAAADMQEIQAAGSLIQILLVACGIAQLAERVSLDQSCGFGIVFLLADDLLHGIDLLS